MAERPARIYSELFDEELEALGAVRKKLISPSVLALSQSEGIYRLVNADVCDRQIGCILCQKQLDRNNKPIIGHWSRSLMDAERAYDTTHRECLAVVRAVLLRRSNIGATHFTILADHDALKWT